MKTLSYRKSAGHIKVKGKEVIRPQIYPLAAFFEFRVPQL